MTVPTPPHDVLIMGGGLAGLTLALQLRQRFADIDVLVLERRAHPVPEACHKVGESTVEIGAHYFQNVLGLEPHLAQAQLRKFGFRFFFSEGRRDIDAVTEIGVSRPLAVSSWQIDRGIFENFLGAEATRRGVRFVDQAAVRTVELSEDGTPHQVTWQRSGEVAQTSHARWLIDASGRAALLKRKLGLAQDNAHAAHAVWFRISEHITIDDWSSDAAWRARCVTPTRWLSTNHLVGAGYWVWLIPLSSGSHSVGIVADPRLHPLEEMNTFERAMQWLHEHQPRLFDALDGRRDKLQDFAFFRRFSYDCKQVFSKQRWALAGEAGRFLDPFYSPGSDFIAIGNTYITELIARDRAELPLAGHTAVYEQIFRSFYDSTMALYVDQYPLFGDPEVLPVKIIWDYTYYWSVLAQLFFAGRLADMAALSHLRGELDSCRKLNVEVQALLRDWGRLSQRRNPAVMLDQASLPWFAELNRSLQDELDGHAFRLRLQQAEQRLRALALEILERACGEHAALDGSRLRALIHAGGRPLPAFAPMLFPAPAALEAVAA
ncbi:MAG: NAD(P)/FAD-dependent oxidoreductase [Rubrivivax sp.]|nr:NAD(P)/FAD-dependent oxidoreductase [Rubrivivax sp.]